MTYPLLAKCYIEKGDVSLPADEEDPASRSSTGAPKEPVKVATILTAKAITDLGITKPGLPANKQISDYTTVLFKTLSRLLRHTGKQDGLQIRDDGFTLL